MRKSIGVGIVLGLCLGLSSQAIRGDPIVPDCAYCDCAVSKAWRFTNMAGFRVLTTQPSGNTAGYGDPVSDARWKVTPNKVFSATCLDDNHGYIDAVTYNSWNVTNASWNDNCQRLQGQTGEGWVVVAVGTGGSQDPLGTARRNWCGP